jgi:hypothetical protein
MKQLVLSAVISAVVSAGVAYAITPDELQSTRQRQAGSQMEEQRGQGAQNGAQRDQRQGGQRQQSMAQGEGQRGQRQQGVAQGEGQRGQRQQGVAQGEGRRGQKMAQGSDGQKSHNHTHTARGFSLMDVEGSIARMAVTLNLAAVQQDAIRAHMDKAKGAASESRKKVGGLRRELNSLNPVNKEFTAQRNDLVKKIALATETQLLIGTDLRQTIYGELSKIQQKQLLTLESDRS